MLFDYHQASKIGRIHLKFCPLNDSELGFETLEFSTFYKIKETNVPKYLFDLILQTRHLYNTHSLEDVPAFYCKTGVFKYSFFP